MKTLEKLKEIDKAIINLSVDERHEVRNTLCKQAGAISYYLEAWPTTEYRELNNFFYNKMKDEDLTEIQRITKSLNTSYQILLHKYKLPDMLEEGK